MKRLSCWCNFCLNELFDLWVIFNSLLGLHVDQNSHFLEDVEKRTGLSLVFLHSWSDDFLSIILSDYKLMSTCITNTFLFREKRIHWITVSKCYYYDTFGCRRCWNQFHSSSMFFCPLIFREECHLLERCSRLRERGTI